MNSRFPSEVLRAGARRMADSPFVALILSATYPAIFLLSLNWYAFSTEKIVFVLLAPLVASVTAYAVITLIVWALFAGFPALEPGNKGERRDAVTRMLIGLLSSAILLFLLFGTLRTLLPTNTLLVLCFAALTGLMVFLAASRLLRYWTAALSIMILASLATWVQSAIAASSEAVAEEHSLIHSRPPPIHFKTRPNIYLIVYDGYGNKRLHRDVFGVDNSAIYGELASRNFKIIDTFSNYWSSWGSMLSVFLGEHHYYHVLVGAFDTRIGRLIMNGTRFNPTYSVLKDNGYNLQLIEPVNYLVADQGHLDYHYPDLSEPVYVGLRVFNNPLLDRLPSSNTNGAPNSLIGYVNDMTEILLDRLQKTANSPTPWFTYIHFPLPAHGGGPFRSLGSWEDVYREDTRKANAHMLPLIDKLLSVDPDALIILMGDHGSFRYSQAWQAADDPNEAFRINELDSDVVAEDYFGIIMAVRSRGRCDNMIYDAMTPVNLMRTIFACLSGDRGLLDGRVEDITIFPGGVNKMTKALVPSGLYMAVKDGKILKPWVKIQR
jgi:hypothetical protein